MRRIDALGITLGIFIAGGGTYLIFQLVGFDGISAGIWTQALLVAGLIVWLSTYLFRVSTKNMTYNRQLEDYEEAVLQKRLDEMTPEEIAKLQAEIEAEKQAQIDQNS
ncbi:MAG: DUF3007 family protein [Xenococcaceae cyanobacterium]